MSTKIHNGYRIAAAGLLDPFEFLNDLRAVTTGIYRDLLATALARTATGLADAAVRNPEQSSGTQPLTQALQEANRAHREIVRTGQRNPAWDFGFDLVLVADPDDRDWRYALIYTEQDAYTDAWETNPVVNRFGYWNNTDRPDDVTETEWDRRRTIWNRVLPGYTAPASIGFTWSLLSDDTGHSLTDIQPVIGDRIPSREERARMIARTEPQRTPGPATMAGMIDYVTSTSYQDAVTARAAQIAHELPDINVDDLYDIRGLLARTRRPSI